MEISSLRKALVILFSLASMACVGVGVVFAIHSPLFLVQVVEIGDQPKDSPVDPQTIAKLAAVPVGKVNLFELDLNAVEKRILTHPWIRRVNLQKRFPQTLAISVVFRQPHALLQERSGALVYVDSDGTVFGHVNVLARSDLPLISGIDETDTKHIEQALELIDAWKSSEIHHAARLSSVSWQEERGYHVWAVYNVQKTPARTVVDLGQEVDSDALTVQLHRLGSVLSYLSKNSLIASQIWADSGKKIVVRTAHGS